MNVLFLALTGFESFEQRNIYTDLLREFMQKGHRVCCVSPFQKDTDEKTHLVRYHDSAILRLQTGNALKSKNLIEKGLATLFIEPQFIHGIKTYFSDIKFDLVLYATPPVTFAKVIKFVKQRDGAKTYLMLKDIFPQNSIDLGMLKKTGIKGLIYKYFRYKEKKLYKISDKIGCMSQANVDYLLKYNPEIPDDKVEICPNCMEFLDVQVTDEEKTEIRKKYDLPLDKKIFVYGGNLGKPQDVPFIVECLKVCADIEQAFFVIAGSGTDRCFLEKFVKEECKPYLKLFEYLPTEEYEKMLVCCDVGLIFLDYRFTIPNFPSRILSYMQAGLPVLACTDCNTDMGTVIDEGQFGWQCRSDSTNGFYNKVKSICGMSRQEIGQIGAAGKNKLESEYSVSIAYEIIMRSMNE